MSAISGRIQFTKPLELITHARKMRPEQIIPFTISPLDKCRGAGQKAPSYVRDVVATTAAPAGTKITTNQSVCVGR